jgi:ankyrin repeat protein
MDSKESNNFAQAKKELQKVFTAVKEAPLDEIKKVLAEYGKIIEPSDEKAALITVMNDTKEGSGKTVLHFAAARGDLDIFKYLIENGGDYDIPDEEGNTPLLVAAQHKSFDLCKYLIETKGLDVNHQRKGSTGLIHIAASEGETEFIEYLLSKGANVDLTSELGTPLEWAIQAKKKKVADLLLKKGANPNGVHAANTHMFG